VRFAHVTLAAPADRVAPLRDFYGDTLGIELAAAVRDRLALALGETTLELVVGDGAPFYHFALLVPGDRFDEALDWARARTELLPDRDSGEVVFDGGAWDSRACYFHDPAENVVELIAHRGIGEAGARGAFRPAELVGLSELGLVGDIAAMARGLAELGLEVWDGNTEPGSLAFVGERARTLILAPLGRGWMPTGQQPAERHRIDAVLAGPRDGEVELEGGRYRITSRR
jgi:catechol 2,3-dioxygenase-like lactoylglutathione lyase family enzyme